MGGVGVEVVHTVPVHVWSKSTHRGCLCGRVHTWRLPVWRKSTHRPSKKHSSKRNHHPRPPTHTPDHRFHRHVDAYMTGFSLKNIIPRHHPNTTHQTTFPIDMFKLPLLVRQ